MKKEKLIKKAKYHYKKYNDALDNYDCGVNLAKNISYEVSENARLFNLYMDELSKIDKNCPTLRL